MNNLKILFFVSLIAYGAHAQQAITVDDFTTKSTFSQKTITGINWMNTGKFYTALDQNKIVKYDITTGQPVETLLDGSTLSPALEIENYSFSSDEKKLLLQTNVKSIYRWSYMAAYYVYDFAAKTIKNLSPNGDQSYAAFSPDATKVGFVRANNLFYVNLSDMSEVQITNDGKFNHVINGTTDWVYEEEFSFVNGFYWSPDGNKLAYYRFDESEVKEYNLQRWNHGQLYPEDYRFKYPKAGEANSKVEIWMYDLNSKRKVKADLGSETDIYVPRVMWTQDPNILSIRKLNRLQNHLELIHANATDGKTTTVISEKTNTYIDIEMLDDLKYLNDGKQFIYSTEKSGYKHLYLYDLTGKQIRQLTTGDFEVLEFIGLDEKSKMIYYTSTEVSALQKHFYVVSLDGKKKTKLSQATGTHKINMSTDFQFYIDHHSSANRPVIASLYKTKGNTLIKTLETNEQLAENAKLFQLSPKEFFSYPTVDGAVINGFMLKPNNFDASRKYPVLIYQYSGPGSQNVADAWGGNHLFFHQMLVQKGYIVVLVDTRGTGARGEQFKKLTYKQLGKYELEDLIEAAKYLASLNYVDGSRIGVWGWSYGGYMTSLAMTKGGGLFKIGIAVSPVTNWRFYDTVYTERYLQTPQLNAEGYDQNSPLTFAADLQGKFLLIHGTGDDNVHFQNSVVFEEALINAGKKFQSFYYPDKTHSIAGGKTRHHLYSMMVDFVVNNL
jgi:dipeptidyl-peptidase-4